MYPKEQQSSMAEYDDTDKGNLAIVQILKWANQDSVLISMCVLLCNVRESLNVLINCH